jgi:hypothetical protein
MVPRWLGIHGIYFKRSFPAAVAAAIIVNGLDKEFAVFISRHCWLHVGPPDVSRVDGTQCMVSFLSSGGGVVTYRDYSGILRKFDPQKNSNSAAIVITVVADGRNMNVSRTVGLFLVWALSEPGLVAESHTREQAQCGSPHHVTQLRVVFPMILTACGQHCFVPPDNDGKDCVFDHNLAAVRFRLGIN